MTLSQGKSKLGFLRVYALAHQSNNLQADKFYKLIHSLLISYSQQLNKVDDRLSLEIMSSSSTGIIYYICAPEDIVDLLAKQLRGLYPTLLIDKSDNDYLDRQHLFEQNVLIKDWRFGLDTPITNQLDMLLANFNSLKEHSLVAIQFVISPQAKQSLVSIAIKLVLAQIRLVLRLMMNLLFKTKKLSNRNVHNSKQSEGSNFLVCVRTLVASIDKREASKLNKGLEVSLTSFKLTKYKPLTFNVSNKGLTAFINRSLFRPCIVNEQQLAAMYYWPNNKLHLLADLKLNPSLQLNPPTSHTTKQPDYILGICQNGNDEQSIGLSCQDRQRHMLLVGGTGMGKTMLMMNLILQDMVKGNGLALIDPHGDLAQDLLGLIPASRLKDVIYFNPSDLVNPLAINLMELPAGLSDNELLLAKDIVAESIISIFRKIFSNDDDGGHRIEYILRNAIYTAFYADQPTLFTLHRLLTNDIYRRTILAKVDDKALYDFWYGEFHKAGNYQRVKMISGVTAKLGRYWQSSVTRNILSATSSSFDFDSLINSNKILICNFAKGKIGEDTASLLAMTVLAKIQLSVWRRSLTRAQDRQKFYLYLDEFQTFYSPSIIQLISEARKFGLSLTLAEQSLAYQKEQDINIMLANIGNVICFRTSSQIDVKFLGPLFEPYISRLYLNNLATFNFYFRSADLSLSKPMSAQTLLIKTVPDKKIVNQVISNSRKLSRSITAASEDIS